MDVSKRKAVSPIIATLLLIAITVAAGVIVYIFVTGLSSNLTKSGGSQVTEQISMDSYNFASTTSLTVYLHNTGSETVNMTQFYLGGSPITTAVTTGGCYAKPLAPTLTCTSTFTVTGVSAGESVTFKVITASGGIFPFSVTAGSTG
ncbi:MAG: type IV pilin [Nitrososphaerota archaeon]|nr:type IV pilin [Nitrososphaerota archaeon]